MANTTFNSGTTITKEWLNDVNTTTYTTVPAMSTTVDTINTSYLPKTGGIVTGSLYTTQQAAAPTEVVQYSQVSALPGRNIIINGGMLLLGRNTGTITSTLSYLIDKWYGLATFTAAPTTGVTQLTAQDGNNVQCLNIVNSVATTTNLTIGQRIEANLTSSLFGKTVILSFYAAADGAANTLNVRTVTPSSTDYYSGTNTNTSLGSVTLSSTLKRYSFTFTYPNQFTGLGIEFVMPTLNAGKQLWIGNVQLEVGTVATAFEYQSQTAQLLNCQRYFSVISNPNITSCQFGIGFFSSATSFDILVTFPVTMKSYSLISTSAASTFTIFDGTTSFTPSAVTVVSSQQPGVSNSVFLRFTVSGATVGRAGRLQGNSYGSYIYNDADLY